LAVHTGLADVAISFGRDIVAAAGNPHIYFWESEN